MWSEAPKSTIQDPTDFEERAENTIPDWVNEHDPTGELGGGLRTFDGGTDNTVQSTQSDPW